MTWHTVDGSAAGTSHHESNVPCQDAVAIRTIGDTVVAVLADGAGSASEAERGAQLVCTSLLDAVAADLANATLDRLDDDAVRGWFVSAHGRIAAEARANDRATRAYAATGLVCAANETVTVCAQIGDGGIVVREPAAPFAVAMWPHNGEYANETYFVTDEDVRDRVTVVRYGRVEDVVVFSDGLGRLALDFAARAPFERFFTPLIATVRGAADVEQLRDDLRTYLDSAAINARTDDDKAIAIATRR